MSLVLPSWDPHTKDIWPTKKYPRTIVNYYNSLFSRKHECGISQSCPTQFVHRWYVLTVNFTERNICHSAITASVSGVDCMSLTKTSLSSANHKVPCTHFKEKRILLGVWRLKTRVFFIYIMCKVYINVFVFLMRTGHEKLICEKLILKHTFSYHQQFMR